MNKAIHTDNAPAAIGPYSQAVRCGSVVYVSGQLPIDPATGAFAGEDVAAQTRQSLTNIKNILAAEGLDMSHVVKTTVMLKDIADFAAMGSSPNGPLYISKVLHKTYISVDEKGTRAGAATAVAMDAGAAPIVIPVVHLDRPFLYMLVDLENNLPAFIGAVTTME